MAPKNNLQYLIRKYQAEDKDAVISLFCNGILEHVYPAFFKAMSNTDQIGVTLSISMAGYVLGGSSYFMALLFGGAWAGLIYYCCFDLYEGYRLRRMNTDMADIQASYLDNPDNGFWVAEAELNGTSKVAGVVAVIGWKEGHSVGIDETGQDESAGSYCEVLHLIVSFGCRKKGLGSQMTQKVMEFCKERGFSRVVLEISSTQAAAYALLSESGFIQTRQSNAHGNHWFSKLANIQVMRMEKEV
ncbi:putative N-acetyltransferase 8B [Esox lucius]|uniref:putative N-acetyltransferase 8B n=1 Tax=Esox lucius TaxID=8010 RepID=UPI001476B4E5|nr:putative N-acetyltransferase 8B [Esox lucius]